MAAKFVKSDKWESYAVEIGSDRVAIAEVTSSPKSSNRPLIRKCDFRRFKECLDLSNCNEITKNIAALIKKHNLEHAAFHCVLQPPFYKLLLIDEPSVPAYEHKSAVRWQIKDMIDFPLEDVVVDLFHPSPLLDAHKKKIYTVVARSSVLVKLYESFQQNLINVSTFDIQELAMRNLLSFIENNEEPIALLQISNEDIALIIFQKNDICFARRIPINLTKLIHENRSINVMLEEIQRSLNYYQTELKQKVPQKMLIAPLLAEYQTTVEEALQDLGVMAEFIDLNKLLTTATSYSNEEQVFCYAAIGGALRGHIL